MQQLTREILLNLLGKIVFNNIEEIKDFVNYCNPYPGHNDEEVLQKLLDILIEHKVLEFPIRVPLELLEAILRHRLVDNNDIETIVTHTDDVSSQEIPSIPSAVEALHKFVGFRVEEHSLLGIGTDEKINNYYVPRRVLS